ncbi:MAG TPA: PIG-L family deacetylase [Vicinamibacterales bacterium]|nr:PIG-L family deacetylase [Vicinamibacterales bacterium]
MNRHRCLLYSVLAAGVLGVVPAAAQLRVSPVAEHPGDVSLDLMLRKLGSSGTFMETTAHPDDEDNALLAMLGDGDGMRTVLVTATRGSGGQNEIGPELFQSLGVLRTEELLAVHRFDGAEQYFTRAIDFGYSFSVQENIQRWGHDEVLGDFVRLIRTVRPDVIAGFLCGGTGGGQAHQATTVLTREAFRAAADPAKYPEQIEGGLRPWQAQRVYCTDESAFMPNPPPRTPDLWTEDVSRYDPAIGRTYAALGLEARSMHKCQGTSQLLLLPGQSQDRTYELQDTANGTQGIAPKTLFEGIDTSLAGLTRFAGAHPPPRLASQLHAIAADVDAAAQASRAHGPAAAVPPLAAGLAAVRALRAGLANDPLTADARYEIDFRLAQKERQFQQALVLADAVQLDALGDDGTVVVGQHVTVSVYAGAHGSVPAVLQSVTLSGFEGTPSTSCTGPLEAAHAVTCKANETIPAGTHLSTPYWTPRTDAARDDVEPGVPFGVPFRPSPFHATFRLTIGGADVSIDRVVEYRYSDVMAGEKRMWLSVVPPFDVRMSPDIAVIPTAALASAPESASRQIEVTTASNQQRALRGMVRLEAPDGWRITPASAPVTFGREDEQVTTRFTVAPPSGAKPGEVTLKAVMTGTDGQTSNLGTQVVEYPHIHRRQLVQAAATRVKVMDVAIAPGLRVGYVMGVGDRVPAAIAQLGARVQTIDADMLASGDLSGFDVIVTGVRAYERRPDLRANNQRLLQYAANGGTVLVQYNRTEFNQAQYGPYPAKVTSERVTDENAPVQVLAPDNPIFTYPNRIGPEAWAGWVQERGTYFLGDLDTHYVDLLRMQDPFPFNAGPKTGALVEATVGKGHWVYIGLSLWRQLPAGTDGAYRLMANLLSLGKK